MLNEEKIRWMTRASIYEKRQGHTDLERNEYFLGDYVRLHLMKNMIGVTVAYILMVGLYAVCKIEDIFALAANMQLMVFLEGSTACLPDSCTYLYGYWYYLLCMAVSVKP